MSTTVRGAAIETNSTLFTVWADSCIENSMSAADETPARSMDCLFMVILSLTW